MKRRVRNDSESDNDEEMLPPPQKKQKNNNDRIPKGILIIYELTYNCSHRLFRFT